MAALRDHGFRPYTGARTLPWSRFSVITRYALRDLLGQRKVIVGLVAAVVWPLIAAVLIYLHHNAEALNVLQLPVDELIPINAGFFLRVLKVQAFFAFFLTLVAGSTLISVDMRDNGLPLYLGHPLSRFEYVLGKLAVVALLASLPTWVLGLVLFGLQGSLAGLGWVVDNAVIAFGLFIGSWVLILLFGLVVLAISALLRAKAAAEVSFVAFFIALPIIGKVIEEFLRTSWGKQFHLPEVFDAIWRPLFGMGPSLELSAARGWLTVLTIMGLAAFTLFRRVKAYEVVR